MLAPSDCSRAVVSKAIVDATIEWVMDLEKGRWAAVRETRL